MKVILNEEQFEQYKKYLAENSVDERQLPKKAAALVKGETDALAKELYGDRFGQRDDNKSNKFKVEVTWDANIATGLFSIGNQKLSDDTLIINFSSALGCPSVKVCPITQKACYAVAGENRLPGVRRKNIMVQNLWIETMKQSYYGKTELLDKIFSIAELYIKVLVNTKKPIKFIRFNEAGDFLNQRLLDNAALFAKKVKEEYGGISMAYTARNDLDFTKEIDGLPIDKIIKINASREDIKLSADNVKQRFFATEMDFKSVLANNDNVESISDNVLNKLQCRGTTVGKNGVKSVPLLSYGKWNGGEGWYYVCPCSFWKYNKDKAESLFYQNMGLTDEDTSLNPSLRLKLKHSLTPEAKKSLTRILNKVKSPCGVECAVCHDMEGGLTPDGKVVSNYTVLTATHGAGASNYDDNYANSKRKGNDDVVWKNNTENPYGRELKYDNQDETTDNNNYNDDNL